MKKSGYWGMILTVAGALFLVAVRLSGGAGGRVSRARLRRVLREARPGRGRQDSAFRTGLDTMRSFSDFAAVASLSLAMWC